MDQTSPSLLQRLRERPDPDAWQRFTHVYTPFLQQWLRQAGVQPADADDVLQEVLAALLRELPRFHYDPEKGAFRGWLRMFMVNRLRMHRRSQAKHAALGGGPDGFLEQLADPDSESSRRWNQDHDRYVMTRVMELLQPEFTPPTWRAFQRLALDGADTDTVAAELGLTPNAVFIAKSRVLRRLREEVQGLAEVA